MGVNKNVVEGGLVFLNNAGLNTPLTLLKEGNYGNNVVVIDGKEVELKLDFKAGEEPYFVLALPGGNMNKLSRILEEYSRITNIVRAAEVTPPLPPFGKGGNMDGVEKGGDMDGISVKLTNPNGDEVDSQKFIKLKVHKVEGEGEYLEIILSRDEQMFKPGVWKMSVDIETKKNILRAQQDFSWGVLTINTNKAVYQSNTPAPVALKATGAESETAYIQMAVLDEKGETLCDADLSLVLTTPSGKQSVLRIIEGERGFNANSDADNNADNTPLAHLKGGTIYRSGKCGRNNVTDTPDYFAYYDVEEAGEYKMELTAHTANGQRTIFDSFEAKEYIPFEIERIGATRIYPVANYGMKVRVLANEDFSGNIIENIPEGFSLIGQAFLRITNENQKTANNSTVYGVLADSPICMSDKLNLSITDKNNLSSPHEIIFQNVSLKAGDSFEMQYTFDAPDITPELFLAGPLELRAKKTDKRQLPLRATGADKADDNCLIYTEPRLWQIASDAINLSGLVLYFNMDNNDINGTAIYDKSGLLNNGAIHTKPSCPTGYVFVPGNSAYSTSDFCVMQYEAKYDSNADGIGDDAPSNCKYDINYDTWDWNKDVATGCAYNVNEPARVVSTAAGSPITGITHTQVLTACPSGDHMITNAEWMTIARDIEQVNANWTNGTVGSGCLFRGNSGETTCGYNATSDPEKGTGRNARAKFILSSGEEIYDISGNVWEHVKVDGSDTLIDNHPTDGGAVGWRWIEFTAITGYGDLNYNQIRPSDPSWDADQGMGRVYTYNGVSIDRVFLRGGYWYNGADAGAFTLRLSWNASGQSYDVGLRCAR